LKMSSVDLEKPGYWQYKFGGFVEGIRIHAPAGKKQACACVDVESCPPGWKAHLIFAAS